MSATGTPERSARWWPSLPPVDLAEGTLAEVDATDLVDLRRAVLRDGRTDLPASYPFDTEPSTLHLGVITPGGSAVGGVSVVVDPLPGFASLRLALMAVEPGVQARGIGRHLVLAVQDRAGAAGLSVWAAARLSALDFYTGLGFRARGDVYVGPMDLPHRHVLWRPVAPDGLGPVSPDVGARSGPSRPAGCGARSAG